MCVVQKPQEQMKSSAFLLMVVTERWWAGHGCRPSVMAGNWSLENRHVFLSSLRELCLLLAFTVCHAAERHGYTLSFHTFFHPAHHGIFHSHILDTSKRKHVILLSTHSAKRPQCPLRELCSSSADRSAEPSPSFIYLSIRLPVFMPCHLSPVFICSQRISQ